MKPLVIDMQAFGPFAERQVIDFRELGSKTFFLIHGPTGSGKTSILDGMCFALFGDSSGGERDGRQMRSHHADGDTLTEVRFDFALGADRYRVRRVPEQMRRAKRGGGETKQLQGAELWRLETVGGTETERPLAAGWIKVTEAIVGLLGFESRQFRQVIMLPQGKFFEFLKSNSQERERILQALFGTELYKRIEEQLKATANEVSRQAETVRTQRQTLLDQALAENEATLDARQQQQTEHISGCRVAEQTTATESKASEHLLAEARSLGDRFAELDKATTALQTLRGQEQEWSAKRSQLAGARRATGIQPYATNLAELVQQLNDEVVRSGKLAADLVTATDARKNADSALEREKLRAPEMEKAISRTSELDALVDKVTALAKARAEQATATTEATGAAAALTTAQQTQKEAAAAHQKIVSDIQTHRVQAAGLDGLKQTHTALTKQLAQASVLATRNGELATATKQVNDCRAAAKKAEATCVESRKVREQVRHAWIAGQAARLAHELVDGQGCPVCGASEHPTPAHADGELVLDDTLKAAEDALGHAEATQRDAEQKLAAAVQAVSVLEARIAEVRSTLAEEGQTPEQLKAQADAAQAKLRLAEAAARALQALEPKLPAADLAMKNAETSAKSAETAAQQAQAKLQRMAGQLEEREAGIPAELRDPAALQVARTASVKTRDSLKQALDAATTAANKASTTLTEVKTQEETSKQAVVKLAAQKTEKARDFDERLKAAQFADAEAYRAARLDDEAIATLETGITAYDASLIAAGERQARAAAETRDLLRPDLAAQIAKHEASKAAQLAASNAVRDALAALDVTTKSVESLKRLSAGYQTLEARFAVLKQVADVASGANPQRMSFQRYVLATLLDEVLAATTMRLRVMSRGRYEMRRKLQAGDQRAAAGLDLEVFDQYTGTTRAVSTLSGGESFLASLALALGLSDVVQSYAGGIRLDAIFVDEGFGTLDPEALDYAIRTLKDLQQAGRLVGIISHVAELKEWIDARLEVKASQTGSVAAFVL